MNGSGRAIKGVAMAFAIFLICVIVSSICGAGILAARVLGVWDHWGGSIEPGEITVIEDESWSNWTSEEARRALKELDIDVKTAGVRIVESSDFRVETNNRRIVSSYENGKLRLREQSFSFWEDDWESELVIYLPNNLKLENLTLSSGAARVEIASIVSDEVKLNLGAGKVTIHNLAATRSAKITGGAGLLEILDGEIRDLDFDMGVGKAVLNARLEGDNDIDAGVGKLEIGLKGSLDDYRLRVSKGIGSIKLNGQDVNSDQVYGNGSTEVKIDGGVGAIEISSPSA